MDRELRDLLTFLRDVCHEAAGRIDHYLESTGHGPRETPREARRDAPRDVTRESSRDAEREPRHDRGRARDPGTRAILEKLRDEVRWISGEAGQMDAALLRLYVVAVTAETRALQSRIQDPEDEDIAAKIMRTLTAIASDHRPGHVYGLARHHQADWDDVARRAREEIRARPDGGGGPGGTA